ncbi:unnamed protein product [Cuscuta europaea]|uniref:Uncharacterized protein n=1 Tax=Cuscuta europaea TaxID=41803 RepID=A0A9P0ZQG3_CUSEU|nr:unnamed protein product [Cuscuta europaea]
MAKYKASTDNQIKTLMMQITQNNVPGRQPGNLPSTTEPNTREHVQAITLRSGRQTTEQKNSEEEETPSMTPEKHIDAPTGKSMEPTRPNTKVTIVKPSLPFPSRVINDDDSRKYNKFLDLLKQLHVNLPLMDALAEMPKYAKFFKDLLTNKRQLEELSIVDLNAECSAVVLRSIPEKLKDPGSFTIPCSIDNFNFNNALADLGASINLMPSSIVEKLGLGEMKPTRMCLQLADRSVKYPKGIVEDVLVKVDKFIFPVDFVVMDMEEDRETPLILGRPFLATARALIDVTDGSLTLRVGDDLCTFRLSDVMKHPTDSFQGCHFLDTFESVEGYLFGGENGHVSDKACLLKEANRDISDACESCEDVIIEQASREVLPEFGGEKNEQNLRNDRPLELKKLPDHLEYAFLDDEGKCTVVITAHLSEEQRGKLFGVLMTHKQTIAWKLEDINGISPTFCTHTIKIEEGFKPVVQPQRHLNPNMMEVVRAEIVKLLDAGIIYPISDSQWVSQIHFVPKKGGMTVTKNEKGELLPSRTVTGWRMVID